MIRTFRVLPVAMALAATPLAAQQSVNLPARDTPLRAAATPVFTVGVEEGRREEMFSGVRAIAFDRSDNLYVLDQQNFRVAVFDARGRFVRSIGRRGQGPGELQAPLGLAVTATGQVVVSDLANRAFVVYSATGEHVRNVPFSSDIGMLDLRSGIHFDSRSGGIVARANPRRSPDQPQGPNRATLFRQPLREGAALQPVLSFDIPEPRQVDGSGSGNARRVMMISTDVVFGVRPSFGVLPDGGLAVSRSEDYSVNILDPAGRGQRVIRRDSHKPRTVTKKDQEAWRERRAEAEASGTAAPPVAIMTTATGGGAPSVSFGGPGGGRGEPLRISEDMFQFAETMSVITDLRTDPQGRVWIQRRNPDGADRGPIDVVTSAGRYIGTLPAQALPDAFSASGLAGYIVRDELGIERVAVRRLTGPLAAAAR